MLIGWNTDMNSEKGSIPFPPFVYTFLLLVSNFGENTYLLQNFEVGLLFD